MATLKQGLTALQSALAQIPRTGHDKFHAVIEPAAAQFAAQCQELLDMYNTAKTDFEALANKYGEDGAKIPPEEFFGMLGDFAKQFDAAKADVFKGKEVKLKVDPKRQEMLKEIVTFEAEKLKKPEKRKAKRPGKGPGSDAGGGAGGAGGDEPNILSSVGSLATKIARDRKGA